MNTILKIYDKDKIQIFVKKSFDADDIKILKQAVYGTNGPKYQHNDQEVKLQNLKNASYFNLFLGDVLVGFYCIVKRDISTNKKSYQGYYGRYLAIKVGYQGKGLGLLLKVESVKYVKSTINEPSIFYSYIEESNKASIRISEKDKFEYFSFLHTIVFSRLYPNQHPGFCKIDNNDLMTVKALLKAQNKNFTLQTLENIGFQNNYFAIKHNDEIVVGLQANPVSWVIKELEGFGGIFILKILPKLPILKRLINPNNHRFLAIEGIFVKPGHEKVLYSLIESALKHFDFSSAICQLDFKDPILNIFKKFGTLGILNMLRKKTITHVLIKPVGFELLESDLINGTTYVSSFDYT